MYLHHLHLSYFPSTAVIGNFFLYSLQMWKYLFGQQRRHSSFVDKKYFWHHLLFAVQLNRLIRANKEQLWHQHLSSSSFSVDLSCYIDLSKKSQGCHAAWRVNQAFDRLTSFFKKIAHHKVNFTACQFTADFLVYTPNLPKVSPPIFGLWAKIL